MGAVADEANGVGKDQPTGMDVDGQPASSSRKLYAGNQDITFRRDDMEVGARLARGRVCQGGGGGAGRGMARAHGLRGSAPLAIYVPVRHLGTTEDADV